MFRNQDNHRKDHPWDFFHHIYCINTVTRNDRRGQALAQFSKVGLAERVWFVTVEPHPQNSERGIFESHQLCLQRGLSEGAKHIVIFEDDVVFNRYSIHQLENCVRFLKSQDNWQAFFFGCLVKKSRMTSYPGIVEINYRSLAHAYVVRRGFAQQLVNKPWQDIPFDVMLAHFNQGFYAAYPAFAFQSNASTDNTRKLRLDRFRRRCGGLMRIQKANEWIHRHMSLLVAVHVVLIGLMAILIWRMLI